MCVQRVGRPLASKEVGDYFWFFRIPSLVFIAVIGFEEFLLEIILTFFHIMDNVESLEMVLVKFSKLVVFAFLYKIRLLLLGCFLNVCHFLVLSARRMVSVSLHQGTYLFCVGDVCGM